MTGLGALITRNCKLFFKDKGAFFVSLITPGILLVLYTTFLQNIYRESFVSQLTGPINVSDRVIDGFVGGQLVSSLLAVTCVTVAFCSNMLVVTDKVTGARGDLTVSPVGRTTLALSYYIAAFISTLVVSLTACALSFGYLAMTGWFLSVADVLCLLLDVVLLVLFGTALSSLINQFLSTQGQISAVGTIVSAGYGFICGAYMPISSFGEGLQRFIMFLPGTYGTSLIRNHAMRGAFAELKTLGFPDAAIESIRDSIDCNLSVFGSPVSIGWMYAILGTSVALLIGTYVLVHVLRKKAR